MLTMRENVLYVIGVTLISFALLLLMVCSVTGCSFLQNAGAELRTKVEPTAIQADAVAGDAEAWAVNADEIAQRVNSGEDVSQADKEALAAFTNALATATEEIKTYTERILQVIQALPQKR